MTFGYYSMGNSQQMMFELGDEASEPGSLFVIVTCIIN